MTELPVSDVVYTRRPGRSPLTCSVCQKQITEGQRYKIVYLTAEQGGKLTVKAEAHHLACKRAGV
jgi:hypothetical protein